MQKKEGNVIVHECDTFLVPAQLTCSKCFLCRAKLADWLASKGKTLKRPAMAVPSKTSKVSTKPEADLQPQSTVEAQPPAQRNPEPSLEAQKPDLAAAAACADTRGAAGTEHSLAPVMMNTSLDLLENSDADLAFDPQDSVEDVRTRAEFLLVF